MTMHVYHVAFVTLEIFQSWLRELSEMTADRKGKKHNVQVMLPLFYTIKWINDGIHLPGIGASESALLFLRW